MSRRITSAVLMTIVVLSLTRFLPVGGRAGSNLPGYLPQLLRNWPPPTPTPVPAWFLLTEIMYNPEGEEPELEWVEVANVGDFELEIGGFLIGDEETPGGLEGMYQFPPVTKLAAHEVIVIANRALSFQSHYQFWPDFEFNESDPSIPNMVEYQYWSSGPVVLSNTSDEVLLRFSFGDEADSVSWGASTYAFDPGIDLVKEGWSLERIPARNDTDQAIDWLGQPQPNPGSVDLNTATPTFTNTPTPSLTPTATATATATGTSTPEPSATGTSTPTPTSTWTQAPPGVVVISEVMYHPDCDTELDCEWIELFNPGQVTVDLSNHKLGDEEQKGGGEGMFLFPPGTLIVPGKTLVIAHSAAVFLEEYGTLPDLEMVNTRADIEDMERYTAWAGGTVYLNNTGDEVILLDRDDKWRDAVSWGSSVEAFNPAVPLVATGHSLERYPPDQDSNSAEDWRDQPLPSPGSVPWTLIYLRH